MSDLEFMSGICQAVLNPFNRRTAYEMAAQMEPAEEEEQDYPGYEKEYIITPNNEQLIKYRKWGF